jgi:hypothetical protein
MLIAVLKRQFGGHRTYRRTLQEDGLHRSRTNGSADRDFLCEYMASKGQECGKKLSDVLLIERFTEVQK